MSTAIATYTKQHLPLSSNTARTANLEEERRHDEIGHWVLRLAFSRSPELRARFIRAELALFRHRFETDDVVERSAFLSDLKLDWVPVPNAEKEANHKQLRACMPWVKEDEIRSETWYKVSWIAVPDLVAQRKVFVKGGMAYVPQSMQISLVLQTFGSRLEKALEVSVSGLSSVLVGALADLV
jgi:DNA primase large subunit